MREADRPSVVPGGLAAGATPPGREPPLQSETPLKRLDGSSGSEELPGGAAFASTGGPVDAHARAVQQARRRGATAADILLVGFFLVATTAVGIRAGGRWVNPFGDPGFSWSAVHRVARGEALYRDIFLSYTPLSIEALALGARVFGANAHYWMVANWIPAVLVGALLLLAARGLLGVLERVALATLFMAISLFVPGDGRLVYPYYPGAVHATLFSLGALLFLRGGKSRMTGRAFCAGLFAGIAFACKQEIGVAALVGIMAPLVTDHRRAVRWGSLAAAGAAVAIALSFALAWPLASFDSLSRDSHLWPLALRPPGDFDRLFRSVSGMQSPGWPRAIASSAIRMMLECGLILTIAMVAVRHHTRRAWIPLATMVTLAGLAWIVDSADPAVTPSPVCLSVLVSAAVAIIAFFRRTLPARTFLIGLGTFAALAGLRTVFSPQTTLAYNGPGRAAASLTWVVFLSFLLPELLVPDPRGRLVARRLMAAALLFAAISPALEGIRSLGFPDRQAVATRQGTVFVSSSQARILEALSRSLAPGERIVPIPESNAVDVLFGVRVVSPLVNLMPGWLDTRMEQAMVRRFERAPPDAVVVFDRSLAEFGMRPFGDGYGRALSEWCDRRFDAVEQAPGVRVLRPRKEQGRSRAVSDAGRRGGTEPAHTEESH